MPTLMVTLVKTISIDHNLKRTNIIVSLSTNAPNKPTLFYTYSTKSIVCPPA